MIQCVIIDIYFCVQVVQVIVSFDNQWVDFDKCNVKFFKYFSQIKEDLSELFNLNVRKIKSKCYFVCLVRLRIYNWVDFSFKDFFWSFFCNSFNFNVIFSRCYEYNVMGCMVNYCIKVKFVSDICVRFNQDFVYRLIVFVSLESY